MMHNLKSILQLSIIISILFFSFSIRQANCSPSYEVTSNHLSDEQKVISLGNMLIPTLIERNKKNGSAWLKRTEVQVNLAEHFRPEYTIETVQPLVYSLDNKNTSFWQGRISNQSSLGNLFNLGIGQRWLFDNNHQMVGVNTFLDHSFRHDHSRIGFGVEFASGRTEANVNCYRAITGEHEISRTTTTASYEQAVNGYDLELGSSLSNIPWLTLYIQGYNYDYKYADDRLGYRFKSLFQITPQLSLETGYSHDNSQNGSYANLMYSLAGSGKPSIFSNTIKPIDYFSNLENRLLLKVRRDNNIRVETFTKDITDSGTHTIPETGIIVTLLNTHSEPITDATVSLLDTLPEPAVILSPKSIIATTKTNAKGQCSFLELPEGTYYIQCSYKNNTIFSEANAVKKGSILSLQLQMSDEINSAEVKVKWDTDVVLPSATVQAMQNGQPIGSAVTANAQGIAIFSQLPEGVYTFRATYNNISEDMTAVGVIVGRVAKPEITFHTTTATITVNDGESPIQSASVSTTISGTIHTSTTDYKGQIIFNGLTPGTYAFTASKTGYSAVTINVNVTYNTPVSQTISLTNAAPVQVEVTVKDDLDRKLYNVNVQALQNNNPVGSPANTANLGTAYFQLAPGDYTFQCTYTGVTVTSPVTTVPPLVTTTQNIIFTTSTVTVNVTNGVRSLNGVVVNTTFNNNTLSATTDSQGNATFTGMFPGTYTFNASLSGYNNGATDIQVHYGQPASGTITMTSAVTTGTINATVKTDTNKPLVGATVQLLNYTNNTPVGTPIDTDSNGVAAFTNLAVGEYSLHIVYDVTAAGYSPIVINAGDVKNVTVSYPTENITTTVKWDNETPIQGATVQAYTKNKLLPTGDPVVTNANGVAVLSGLTSQNYTIKATYNGRVVTGGASSGASNTIYFSTMSAYAKIVVKSGANRLIDGASVQAYLNGVPVGSAITTNSSGAADFSGLDPDTTYSFTSTMYGSSASTTVLTRGGSTEDGTITMPSCNANITIKWDTGAPAVNRYARVYWNGVTDVTYMVDVQNSDSNGLITVTGLLPGTYVFSNLDYGTISSENVTVSVSQTGTGTIVLPTGSATVTVKDDLNNPIAGVPVQAVLYSGSVLTGSPVNTASDGTATIIGLPPGQYTFRSSVYGLTVSSLPVLTTISGGQTKTASITVFTGSALVTVQNASSSPVSGASVQPMLNGVAVGSPVVTGVNGTASFPGLIVSGYMQSNNYIFRVTYNNTTTDSSSTSVTQGQSSSATVTVN